MATRAGAIGNLPWVRGTSQPGVKMAPRGAQHKEAITAELKAEATKIGGKQFIQKYGLASWRNIATAVTGGTIGYRVSESIDDTTHKSVPVETGEGTYIGDTGEKERERERIAAEERERMKGAPAPKVETGWKESFPDQSGELIDSSPPPSTPEPIEIPQESFPDQSEEFNKPQIFYSKKDDISEQTKELVPDITADVPKEKIDKYFEGVDELYDNEWYGSAKSIRDSIQPVDEDDKV